MTTHDEHAGDRASFSGAELDAFRRRREDVGPAGPGALASALLALDVGEDPRVGFGRAARLLVPDLCDGCEVEVADGGDAPLRQRTGAARAAGDPPAVHVRIAVESVAGFPAATGILSMWRAGAAMGPPDVRAAELFVAAVAARVVQSQLTVLLRESDRRAGRLALESITSRRLHLAVGVLMERSGVEEDEAESALRRDALRAGRSPFEQAHAVVRDGRGATRTGAPVRHLPAPGARAAGAPEGHAERDPADRP